MRPLASLIVFCLIYSSAIAETTDKIPGKVVNVFDGNTLEILTDKKEKIMVVLADIDSPELTQEFGEEAKHFLQRVAMDKYVLIALTGKDRKGNNLGIVLIQGKTDVRIELLQRGLAWTAERNPNPELEQYRTTAQSESKGLWKQPNPTPPWIHRREQSMLQPKSS